MYNAERDEDTHMNTTDATRTSHAYVLIVSNNVGHELHAHPSLNCPPVRTAFVVVQKGLCPKCDTSIVERLLLREIIDLNFARRRPVRFPETK